jgi:hypothetical protein
MAALRRLMRTRGNLSRRARPAHSQPVAAVPRRPVLRAVLRQTCRPCPKVQRPVVIGSSARRAPSIRREVLINHAAINLRGTLRGARGSQGLAGVSRNTKTTTRTQPKPARSPLFASKNLGDPSRIRTCNPRSRNPLLYPVELWDRRALHTIANMKNPLPGQACSQPFSPTERPTPWAGEARPGLGLLCRYGQYPSARFVRTIAAAPAPGRRAAVGSNA